MSTTSEIKERIVNSIIHEIKKIDSSFEEDVLRKSVEDGLSIAIAPEIKQLERGITEAAKQGCPLTASSRNDSSNGQLENWGKIKILRDPDPAVPGEYTITITGTGTVPAGTQYVDDLTGFVYLLQAEVICVVTAVGTVKSVGNAAETTKYPGTVLYSQTTIPGIDSEAVIAAIVTAPEPAEDSEDYREKTVESFSTTPRGGAAGDYRVWGLEVEGVFKVFPYTFIPTEGIVYIMAPRTDANPYGTADNALKAAVLNYLKLKEPMTTGELYVLSVKNPEYVVEVIGLSDVLKQPLVLPALQTYFSKKYPYIDGVDNEDLRTDRVTKADIFKVVYDAVYPAGVADITVTRSALEITDEFLPMGAIGVPSVTFS